MNIETGSLWSVTITISTLTKSIKGHRNDVTFLNDSITAMQKDLLTFNCPDFDGRLGEMAAVAPGSGPLLGGKRTPRNLREGMLHDEQIESSL